MNYMTKRNISFVVDEWYHCYNYGIDKRIAFEDSQDYYRFLELLYLANDKLPLRHGDIGTRKFGEVMNIPRGKKLVSVGAFCLMPNCFHIVLKESSEGGITTFMRKMGTAYTLYFNSRHKRSGNLFLKPFKSNHVPMDGHLQHLISYVHCNPAALYDPGWTIGHVVDPQFLGERVATYPYSSLGSHIGAQTPTRAILDAEVFSLVHKIPVHKMLQESLRYYADFGNSII
jgi:REP element-mobilizing transposase RayT